MSAATPRPRLCIDVRMLNHAGIGTYIRNVVPRVIAARPAWRFHLITSARASVPDAWSVAGNVTLATAQSDIYSLAEQVELPLKQNGWADLYWSPHYAVPMFSRGRLVVTVHDVAHLALADTYGGLLRDAYARQMFSLVRRRAAHVLFVSEFSRREFESYVGTPVGTTSVTHEAVDEEWLASALREKPPGRPYFLFVGSVKPHKNVRGALEAFEKIAGQFDGDFVIVGEHAGQRTMDSDSIAFAQRLGERVRFTGRLDHGELRAHVAAADALVFPSLYEGFGLPPLEAMAAGTPCIVSDRASLPEVCGDAALYADPLDPSDIARQMLRLVSEPETRADYVRRGREHVRKFSWDATARMTLDALEEVLRAS